MASERDAAVRTGDAVCDDTDGVKVGSRFAAAALAR
jgi:hypothetical protein